MQTLPGDLLWVQLNFAFAIPVASVVLVIHAIVAAVLVILMHSASAACWFVS